eukprot:tig00020553_g10629.t1
MASAEIARWEGDAELWCASWHANYIAAGSIDEHVRIFSWDGKALGVQRSIGDHTLGVVSVDCFGAQVAASTMEGKIVIHVDAGDTEASSSEDAKKVIDVGPGQCWQVCHSPDGKFIATGGQQGMIKVFSTAGCVQEHELSGSSTKMIYSVAYSNRCLAAGAGDGYVGIFDTATLKLNNRIHGHAKPIRGVCFSADGEKLYSCGDDGVISVFDVQSGSIVNTFSGHTGPVYSIALSANGILASASADRTVKLWSLQTRTMLHQFASSHTDQVWGCAFAPSGKELVSAGADGVLVVYDTNAA